MVFDKLDRLVELVETRPVELVDPRPVELVDPRPVELVETRPGCRFSPNLSVSHFIYGQPTSVFDEHDVRRGAPICSWMTVTLKVSTTKGHLR